MGARNSFLTNTVSLNFFKQTLELRKRLCRRQSGCLFFRNDVNVEIFSDAFFVQPKKFAKQPFDPISGNRIPDPFGYSDAKARPLVMTGCKQNDEMCVLYTPPGL